MKATMSRIKNTLDMINCRLDITLKRISENPVLETIQWNTQEKVNLKKQKGSAPITYGTTSSLIHVQLETPDEVEKELNKEFKNISRNNGQKCFKLYNHKPTDPRSLMNLQNKSYE